MQINFYGTGSETSRRRRHIIIVVVLAGLLLPALRGVGDVATADLTARTTRLANRATSHTKHPKKRAGIMETVLTLLSVTEVANQ